MNQRPKSVVPKWFMWTVIILLVYIIAQIIYQGGH